MRCCHSTARLTLTPCNPLGFNDDFDETERNAHDAGLLFGPIRGRRPKAHNATTQFSRTPTHVVLGQSRVNYFLPIIGACDALSGRTLFFIENPHEVLDGLRLFTWQLLDDVQGGVRQRKPHLQIHQHVDGFRGYFGAMELWSRPTQAVGTHRPH